MNRPKTFQVNILNILPKMILLFLILICSRLSIGAPSDFQLIRTIGDERPDYTFYVVNGAIEVDKKFIYVLDTGVSSMNLFKWDGTFVKRTGTRGEGPGDFFYPIAINLLDDRIFLLDRGNRRITEFDRQLNPKAYYRVNNQDVFFSCFYALKDDTFLGNFSRKVANRGKIGLINRKGEMVKSFFNRYPVSNSIDMSKAPATVDQDMHQSRIWIETMPICALNQDRSRLLVSFRKPDNTVTFYLYTIGGKLLSSFSHRIRERNYKISRFYLTASAKDLRDLRKYPDEFHIPVVNALGFYKDHYVVFLNLQDYKKNKLDKVRVFCLIFNSKGKLVKRFPVDDSLRVFCISNNGVILASKPDEEITKIYIHQLNL